MLFETISKFTRPMIAQRMNSSIRIVFVVVFLTLATMANAQKTRRIIEDAWVYIGTWESLKNAENIELVKNWNTPEICLVSFEQGEYFVSNELGEYTEKGKWTIQKQDQNKVIIVSLEGGKIVEFEIKMVKKSMLELKKRV